MEKRKISICESAHYTVLGKSEIIEVRNDSQKAKRYMLFEADRIKTKYRILSESGSEKTLRILGVTRERVDNFTFCFDEKNLQLWWQDPKTGEYRVFNAVEVN